MAKYMRLRLADMLARETGRRRTTEAVLRFKSVDIYEEKTCVMKAPLAGLETSCS